MEILEVSSKFILE